MNKKLTISIITIMIFSMLYLVFKPFVVQDLTIYYKKDNIGRYTIYESNQSLFSEAFETIYDDGDNTYCFTHVRSEKYLLVNRNDRLTLQEALEQELITADELMEKIPELMKNKCG